MFLLDSLMIAGIRWALETTVTAAEAEMNDDSALREQLLEAEMRREMGEISDEAFAGLEADLLARIREIKARREGAEPLAFGASQPIEAGDGGSFQIEASVSGTFHDAAAAPHTTVVGHSPAAGHVIQTEAERQVTVLDIEPGDAASAPAPGMPLTRRRTRTTPTAVRSRARTATATRVSGTRATRRATVPATGSRDRTASPRKSKK